MVLITDTPPSGCLAETYYGTYGGYGEEHIYIPSGDCLGSKVWAASSGSLIPLSGPAAAVGGEQGRLVWVGQAGVEGVDNDIREDWTGIESLSEVALATVPQGMVSSQDGQVVFGDRQVGGGGLSLLHASSKTMLLHVSSTLLPILDTLLPPHLVPVALPLSPLPRALDDTSAPGSMATTNEWKTVPPHYARHLANITRSLKFDAGLDKVLNELNHDQVRRNVRWLTGEGPSGITSRHSFTPGAIKAAHWLKGAPKRIILVASPRRARQPQTEARSKITDRQPRLKPPALPANSSLSCLAFLPMSSAPTRPRPTRASRSSSRRTTIPVAAGDPSSRRAGTMMDLDRAICWRSRRLSERLACNLRRKSCSLSSRVRSKVSWAAMRMPVSRLVVHGLLLLLMAKRNCTTRTRPSCITSKRTCWRIMSCVL